MDERIEKYFSDKLNEQEKAELEQQIRNDETLIQDVAYYIQLKQALKQETLETRHAEWHSNKPVKKLQRSNIFWAAAVLLAVIGAGWYWLHSPSITLEEYAHHYVEQNFNHRNVQMGATKDSMQLALSLFNEGKLQQSLNISNSIIAAHPDNAEQLELSGITYLRLNDYNNALAKFKQMEPLDLYDNPSVLYQAITLLKRKEPLDSQEAEKLLQRVIDENLGGKKVAQSWLNK